MYTGKQYREPISRMLQQTDGKRTQQFMVKDNRERAVVQGKLTSTKIRPPIKDNEQISSLSASEMVSGGSSILGGLIAAITGSRDTYNAVKDFTHRTRKIAGANLTITNANGSLEEIEPNRYKVKVDGNIAMLPMGIEDRQGPPGTRRRIVEGVLNASSGVLNIIGGITSLSSRQVASAVSYGMSSVATGASAALRFLRYIA